MSNYWHELISLKTFWRKCSIFMSIKYFSQCFLLVMLSVHTGWMCPLTNMFGTFSDICNEGFKYFIFYRLLCLHAFFIKLKLFVDSLVRTGQVFCETFSLERFPILRDCVGRRLRLNILFFVFHCLFKVLLLKGEQIWNRNRGRFLAAESSI